MIKERQKPIIRNRIRHCRMSMRLPQKDLAFLMDLDPTQVSKWEQGERLPGAYNTVGLAVATGVLVEEIFIDFRREWQERVRDRWKLLESIRKEETQTYSQQKTGKSLIGQKSYRND